MPQSLPEMVLLGRRSRGPDRRPEQPPRRTRRRSIVALAGVPLFSSLSKRHLQLLAANAEEISFKPTEPILRQGDLGETLFVVMEGQVKVVQGQKTVARLRPGSFFGELSAIDGGPRTATVVAETPVRVLCVHRRTLDQLLATEPNLTIAMLEDVARRIRSIDAPLLG